MRWFRMPRHPARFPGTRPLLRVAASPEHPERALGPARKGTRTTGPRGCRMKSGLPVTTGRPIVGTLNDWSFAGCSGNVGVAQLDTFSWSTPTASHITKVNCMTSFGTAPGASDAPAGWNGHLTSSDSVGYAGTWKSRAPFSKGGIIYVPVERQISAGGASVHDATFIMSPDSGKHWCNPYTYANRVGGPGCDSSNWQADGDAPKCGATSSSTPCTNAAYLDATHSSIMWQALPTTVDNWAWVNYAYQDGQTPPAGIGDGCDPATYTFLCIKMGASAESPTPTSWMCRSGSTIPALQSRRMTGARDRIREVGPQRLRIVLRFATVAQRSPLTRLGGPWPTCRSSGRM